MKKKFLLILSLAALIFAFLASGTKIHAEETEIELSAGWTSENEGVTISDTDVNGIGKVAFAAAFAEPAKIAIPVTGFQGGAETAYFSVKYSLENVTQLNVHMYYSEIDETAIRDQWGGLAPALPENQFDYSVGYLDVAHLFGGFNVTTVDYDEFKISTANIAGYISSDVVVDKIVFEVVCDENASIEFMGMEFTADGNHSFEVPAGELSFGELTGNSVATVTKENDTYVVQYSQSPGWDTVNITVSNYDSALNIFEVVFTPSSQITMCIEINGNIDWSMGHKVYGATRNVEQIDVTAYNLPKNFTIKFYLDSSSTVTEPKTITFESFAFKVPDPEPEGLYFTKPTASALACLETDDGFEISYINDGAELWKSVEFGVRNHTADYDILVVSMQAVAGMKLGVRVYWLDEGTEKFMEVRNHWNNAESIFAEAGDVSLVYNFNAYEAIAGKEIVKVTFYFDPPTGGAPYLVNQGEQATTIYGLEFKKSSELGLQDPEIAAQDMTVTYNGEKVNFVATNEEDLPLKIYYKAQDASDYSENAPRNAGVYDVKVVFMGDLTYNPKTVYAKLTINKADRTVTADMIQFDPETGVITFGEDVLVSTSENFSEANLLTSGTALTENATVYIKFKPDDNYNEAEPLAVELELEQEEPNDEEPNDEEPNGENPDEEPKKKKGCFSIFSGGSTAVFSLGLIGIVFILRRRRTF